MDGIEPGRKVRITLEGYPVGFEVTGNRTYLRVDSVNGNAEVALETAGVTLEVLPWDRPSWWNTCTPGTLVETNFGVRKRVVKRDFMGTVAPEDAETHPWMWLDGTSATDDDVLRWSPLTLLVVGRK